MDIVLSSAPLLYAGVFIFGALVGSFLNVVILRLPLLLEFEWRCQCQELLEIEENKLERPPGIVASRSRCPSCGHVIRPWENIPLVSYILLRSKCSNCSCQISARYPLVELITASLFVVTIWHFGPTLAGLSALTLTAFLIVATGIDLDCQLLPDNMTLPLMWAGLLINLSGTFTDVSSSVVGAIAGYLCLWSIYHFFRLLTGKEGMGYGDFKLLAALGAWMGWQMLPLIILISSVFGALTGIVLMGTGKLDRGKPMAFGPFIAIAGWVAMLWGDKLISAYFAYSRFT